ncbi:MAG: hypothetical protein IKQ41_03150 [Clostridia bacterium]|nr:hypothetical protein [Clostridia bacterium]
MKEDVCILCGRAFPTGLQVMGCLICFPCEKRMLGPALPARERRALARLYGPDPAEEMAAGGPGHKKTVPFPIFREQNRVLLR